MFRDDLRRFDRLKSSRNVSNRLGGFFGFEWSRLVSDPLNSYRYVLSEIQSLKNQSYSLWSMTVAVALAVAVAVFCMLLFP